LILHQVSLSQFSTNNIFKRIKDFFIFSDIK